jgi:AraC family transcriptional activator of pobA
MQTLAQFEPMPATTKAPQKTPKRLPNYRLYGESEDNGGVDWLHCESIKDRGQLHNWEIRPHRHEVLSQFLLIESGRARVQLDGHTADLAEPALVVVPALVAHGFHFSPGAEGWVITVNEAHLGALLATEPTLLALLAQASALQLQSGDAKTLALSLAAKLLADEFLGNDRWRRPALDAAMLSLAVAAMRVVPPVADASQASRSVAETSATTTTTTTTSSRALAFVERYKALVERDFKRQPGMADIAARLGITSTQLNRICQQVLGHSALALLQARIVLQAKRELTYTTLSVKQIADELGFADAAYFTRFFQRETRLTPTAWRQQALS